jgi:hypothetical protein
MKTPKGGGAAIALASAQNVSGNISVDTTSVYWIDSHLDTSKVRGSVCLSRLMRLTPK